MWAPAFPLSQYLIRASVVYAAIVLLLRLSGKRQVGQMGIGEFAAVLLISNAVQNSMNGGDNSLTGGLVLAATLVFLSWLTARLTFKSKRLEELLEGRPTLLVHNGQVLERNLERELLNARDLKIRLRRQGIHHTDEVFQAILESDGSLSVIKKSEVEGGAKGP